MRRLYLFDTPELRQSLYPIALIRPIADIRNGIFTIAQRWHFKTGCPISTISEPYLQDEIIEETNYLLVNASYWPTDEVLQSILNLQAGQAISGKYGIIAYCTNSKPQYNQIPVWPDVQIIEDELYRLAWTPQIVNELTKWMQYDSSLMTISYGNHLPQNNQYYGNENIHIHPEATVQGCIINAQDGKVIIDKGALVMEGTCIRGPVYIGENAVVKMGSHLYGGTNIGEKCTVGGEIKNSIFLGFCNKAHEGYLGDSLIGSWCNLGAGTFVSNVKNTASNIDMWHMPSNAYKQVGTKMGTIMGDYSKTAILTALNTGTTIGICSSLHQMDNIPKHILSFAWGNGQVYNKQKATADIAKWMIMKGVSMDEKTESIINYIFDNS